MSRTQSFVYLLLCGVWCATSLAAEPRLVAPIEGEAYRAQLIGIDLMGRAKFNVTAADGKETTNTATLETLVSWGAPAEPKLGPIVYLNDGGWLAQPSPEPGVGPASVKIAADRVELERSAFGPLSLPVERVRGIVFHPSSDRQTRDRLAFRLFAPPADQAARRDADWLILENGDELSGTIERCDGQRVELTAAVGPVRIEIEKIAALAFNPALLVRADRRGPRTLVGLVDGSRLEATRIELDGSALRVAPTPGLAIAPSAVWTAPAESLVFIQPLSGRATYLSDLTALSYKQLPYLTLAWPYRNDLNVTGTQLRAGERLYAKGLGMHSTARLTYRLDKAYRWFAAELAIDDETRGGGSVTFRVFVDAEERYVSPIVRGGSAPLPVRVDIKGGKQLSLIVDFAERADELDHANWLNARLVE